MKIVTRYILREVINPFAIGVFAFTFLFLANGIFRLMDWIVIGGIQGSLVGGMVLALIPFILNVTFPMALLLGCVFAFGRLSEHNEIQALLTCGHTYGRIVRPVILLGLGCTGFLLFWSEYIAPKASLIQNMTTFRIVEHMSPIAVLEEGKFSTRLPGRVLYLQKIDLADHTVHGVAIFEMNGNKIRAALLSPRGRVQYNSQEMTLSLDLENWEVHVDVESDDPKMATINGRIQMVVDCGSMMGKLLRDKQ
ncbi:MAG TPA: LptF/LptG family permease, partial [bacterium]|nr:LptF/LptG family permease [bacterium]